jgi:hypothetical protein
MKTLVKAMIAGVLGVAAIGVTAANAKKADHVEKNHDQRSQHVSGYDYYDNDRYRRGSGASFTITIGNDGRYYDRYDRYDRRGHYSRRNGYRGPRARIVNREVYNTRYRARIVLVEEVIRTRRGPRLVCTVQARGPEARYVSERRMHRIAHRDCSRRARINVYS